MPKTKMITTNTRSEPKELIVEFLATTIMVLVPKKRGTGFQKVPLGHHYDNVAAFMITLGADIYGLDGFLEIHIRPGLPGSPERERATEKFLDPISKFYGYPWREDSAKFWKIMEAMNPSLKTSKHIRFLKDKLTS